eukprot:CAMPEP_0185033716 /NCGR_PEP_ID=MMETSP1103-20130426/22943_1 /TAXON_ID=36769 /ORGANISM="Paraphysomonas bandaiensis, Strain Caron Lab Isolate" /LENGTH=562 /DNA_ID=CAMNT_0027570095 /DNA_START=97 /DNA_END=1785 /DNA_ORIENTATION=+
MKTDSLSPLKGKRKADDDICNERRSRTSSIDEVGVRLREIASLDLCILIDCTSSMYPYIRAIQRQISDIVDAVRDLHPDSSLRLALISYYHVNDNASANDKCKTRIVVDLTRDVEQFKRVIGELRPGGGGWDMLADVLGGLKLVTNLYWQATTRVLFHIGDMPCHGSEYHNLPRDDYPGGDPSSLTPQPIIRDLQKLRVKYYFGRLQSATDIMVQTFNRLAAASDTSDDPDTESDLIDIGYPIGGEELSRAYIESVDAQDPASVISTLTGAVITSMASNLSDTISRHDLVGDMLNQLSTLSIEESEWRDISPEKAVRYNLVCSGSVADIVANRVSSLVNLSTVPTVPMEVKVSNHVTARTNQRAIFKAMYKDSADSSWTQGFIRFPRAAVQSEDLFTSEAFTTVVTTNVTSILCKAFCHQKPPNSPTVSVNPVLVIQLAQRSGAPIVLLEKRVDGTTEKYNSNHGLCLPCPSPLGTDHSIIQTFSHFTHYITEGFLMVVDCQGVYSDGQFTLLSPSIHCQNVLQFGGTNLGQVGMDRFFKTHKCNHFCKALNLPPYVNPIVE